MTARPAVDRLLDTLVVPGFSRIGPAARRLGPVTDRVDGRTIVVTGATGGIGRSTAEQLARLGAHVVVVGRSAAKVADVVAGITESGGSAEPEVADLSLVVEVEALAGRLLDAHPAIDVLINNVGVLLPERSVTAEGLERTFATNLLGQFVLTNRLVPALQAAPNPARIITVSSGGMYTAGLDVEDLQSERSYSGTTAYARTKRAQVVLTELWGERLGGRGVVAHSMHPGWADTPGVAHGIPTFGRVMKPLLRTADQGADTVVWLAAADEPARQTGLFWHDRQPRATHRLSSTVETPSQRRGLWQSLEHIAAEFDTSTPTRSTR